MRWSTDPPARLDGNLPQQQKGNGRLSFLNWHRSEKAMSPQLGRLPRVLLPREWIDSHVLQLTVGLMPHSIHQFAKGTLEVKVSRLLWTFQWGWLSVWRRFFAAG